MPNSFHRSLGRAASFLVVVLAAGRVDAQVRDAVFTHSGGYLRLEVLDDDLLHFEAGTGAPATGRIATTIMVHRTNYSGPRRYVANAGGIETGEMTVRVQAGSGCFTVTDRVRRVELTTLCPAIRAGAESELALARAGTQHVYGLGEQFVEPGNPNGDWMGRERTPGNEFGNRMVGFEHGAVGNAMFPIMYAVGAPGSRMNYALFVDEARRQHWDFRADPMRMRTTGAPLRGYVMTGANLPDLRADYLELVGRPPVPPKQAFGMWVSEYGYEHWHELETKLATLRERNFPVDGFVLDLQWFGGIITGSDLSTMGSLTWDLKKFPDPRAHIARLRTQEGLGIIPIEEPYIAKGLAEHDTLERRGFLVRQSAGGPPVYLTENPWWGKGGMVDFTHPDAAAFWHDWKRQPLVDLGVLGHWTDLGEPELFSATSWNHGVTPGAHTQADVHNLYNLTWSRSVYEGYERHGVRRRPLILSRSGTSGSQRYGVSMWSGDIGANFASLATHMNAQMHMAMSGMDYFGSDIGGFHRGGIRGDSLDQLYTQWLAAGAMLEVPMRAHTENLCNCKETAPDRVGHLPSNLAILRARYAMTPYYYSLAHRAYRHGEPVTAPLVHYYQDDPAARTSGEMKLIGRDLLTAVVARYGARERDVYLPAGEWIDYRTNVRHAGGTTLRGVSLFRGDNFELPLYARAGAIIPLMHVDAQTMNTLGKRRDGSVRNELIARVFPHATETRFTLYEDDGETIDYRTGGTATTVIAQRATPAQVTVTVGGREGSYASAPASRATVVELSAGSRRVTMVTVNGAALARHADRAALDAAGSGWAVTTDGLVVARAADMPVASARTYVFSGR